MFSLCFPPKGSAVNISDCYCDCYCNCYCGGDKEGRALSHHQALLFQQTKPISLPSEKFNAHLQLSIKLSVISLTAVESLHNFFSSFFTSCTVCPVSSCKLCQQGARQPLPLFQHVSPQYGETARQLTIPQHRSLGLHWWSGVVLGHKCLP